MERAKGDVPYPVSGPNQKIKEVIIQNREPSPSIENYFDHYIPIEQDPDLMLEINFILSNQDRIASACSKPTITDSWRSTTPVKSRGRPIKPYENEPFLCVDMLSLNRLQESSAGSALSTQSYQKGPSPSITGNRIKSAHRSPYSSPTFPPRKVTRKAVSAPTSRGALASRGAGKRENLSRSTGRTRTPASTAIYLSQSKVQKKVNHHIKAPFKHAVNRPDMTTEDTTTPPTTPAQELKERTALATYHMGRIMSREKSEHRKTPTGKLLKGKLKPLKPVSLDGPKINQCRGIVSDAHSYGASPSRTLSRRRQIIQSIPNVHEFLYERPQTVESIHRTSAASSVDENRDHIIRGDYLEPEIDTDRTDKASYAGTDETIPFVPPGSRATASPATQMDINSHRKDAVSRLTEDGDPRMFITEVDGKNKSQFDEQMASDINDKLKLDGAKNNGVSVAIEKHGDDHRPHTAASSDGKHMVPPSRPHTAGEITGKTKSVRFADDSKGKIVDSDKSKAAKEMKNAQIVEQTRLTESAAKISETENKDIDEQKQSKSSCKPSDVDQIEVKKDDEDDKEPPSEGSGISGSNNGNSVAMVTTSNIPSSQESKNSASDSKTSENSDNKGKQSSRQKSEGSTDFLIKGVICPVSPTPRSRSPSPTRSVQRPKSPAEVTRCRRSSDASGQVPSLQIQSVIHGEGVHTVIGPQSPLHRSRSPSPHRNIHPKSPQRSKTTNHRDKSISQSVNNSKTNKLVRPSSANLHGRDKNRYSKSTFTKLILDEKSGSEECLTSRKSKVYFEGENPPHDSVFVESEGDVKLKEDKPLTFADIEAELNAIKDDIIEKRQFEEALEVDIESCHSNSNNSNSVKFDDDMSEEIETISSDYVEKETWRDYSDLLDNYRKKCMEVSEKCGEISNWLTSPRKSFCDRPKSANSRRSSLARRKDLSTSGISSDHVKGVESYVLSHSEKLSKLERTTSETTITDSGYSVGSYSNSTLKHDESCDISNLKNELTGDLNKLDHVTKDDRKINQNASVNEKVNNVTNSVEKLNSVHSKYDVRMSAPVDDIDDNRMNEDGNKALLQMVCDELSELGKTEQDINQENDQELVSDPLEIVASAKKMSKPKLNKRPKNKGPVAPFAPVCFEINARPPSGYLYYFAYGTDMNPSRLSVYIKREVKRFWGLLFGFQLVFNKKGADIEAGGFANIEFNPFFSTEGCIYAITPQELEQLDKHVGYPEHYEHLALPVWLMNSPDPDQYGVAQYCVPAVTYIAQDKWIVSEEQTLNCDYTLSQCVKSSDLLTKSYRDHMTSMNSPIREQLVSA